MHIFKNGRVMIEGVKAHQVAEELDRIAEKRGAITPPLVVEESRPKKALLHAYFEWDDSAAAVEYRLHQARQIVSCVQVVRDDKPNDEPVAAYVSVNVAARGEAVRQYVPVDRAAHDPILRARHLKSLMSRLRTLRREIGAFTELASVCAEIDRLAGDDGAGD